MTTGTALDILQRVKRLIPNRWFSYVAPYRDAIMGGLSDLASWSYNLVLYARAQTRIATAYGIWLDVISYDYLGRFLVRNGMQDDVFRATIRATILQERVTRAGMINALTVLTGKVPWIFEPWNTFDTGAYSGPRNTGSPQYGSMGYGVGQGGYGNMGLPAQTFLNVQRSLPSGVPRVGGYSNPISGYGLGSVEYVGPNIALVGITDDVINKLISMTKPTGSTCWVQIGAPPRGTVGNGMPKRPEIFNSANNTQNLAM